MTIYTHWNKVPTDPKVWPWVSFSPREIACKGTNRLLLNRDAMDRLQALRDRLGVPLILRSAYRSPEHNATLPGAAKNSYHMKGVAFDVAMANHNPIAFEAAARAVGFTGFGYYPRSGFMHIDTGPARTWGTPFKVTGTDLPPETPVVDNPVPTKLIVVHEPAYGERQNIWTRLLELLLRLFGRGRN